MRTFEVVYLFLFSKRTTTVEVALFDQPGLDCFSKSKLESSASRDIIRQY
jgi:hypothetical protein